MASNNLNIDLTHIDGTVPKSVQKFDPSYVTRYKIVTEIVKSIYGEKPKKPVRVLDVGGYNGAAQVLLPNFQVTAIDIKKDDSVEDYISYDGGVMPLDDDSYDIAISCDTLEHVPAAARELFTDELSRVTRSTIILCAPFGSREVAAAELRADTFYQGMTRGDSYIWLKEHKEYGLPKHDWFEKKLIKHGFKTTTFDHTSLDLWEEMLRASFFMANNIRPVAPQVAKKLDRLNIKYFEEFTFSDFPRTGYRTFYIASKDGAPKVKLPDYSPEKKEDFLLGVIRLAGVATQDVSHRLGAVQVESRTSHEMNNEITRQNQSIAQQKDSLQHSLEEVTSSKAYQTALRIRKVRHPKKSK